MTSKKRQKVAFEEIKESEDVMEDEPDNPAERDEHSQTDQDGTENIGGFGHFISSNGLSDESPSPPKIALNQQISTFSIFSKEEMKSSKFVQSESDKSINKLRNSEKEKRLLFEIKEYDIFDQTGCVSQTYKNSFEIKYEINSEYIFKLQNFFSKGKYIKILVQHILAINFFKTFKESDKRYFILNDKWLKLKNKLKMFKKFTIYFTNFVILSYFKILNDKD